MQENFRVESLWLGVLYNVSARFTKTFNGVNYTSEPVMSSFTLEEGDSKFTIQNLQNLFLEVLLRCELVLMLFPDHYQMQSESVTT